MLLKERTAKGVFDILEGGWRARKKASDHVVLVLLNNPVCVDGLDFAGRPGVNASYDPHATPLAGDGKKQGRRCRAKAATC